MSRSPVEPYPVFADKLAAPAERLAAAGGNSLTRKALAGSTLCH